MFRLAAARANAIKGVAQMQRRGLACSNLYVKGLALDTTEDSLRAMAEKFGNVYNANVLQTTPADRFAVGFVKFYAGELPSSVDELAKLPYPPQDEIDAVNEMGQNMIRELSGTMVDGWRMDVQVSIKDRPDNIQFRANFQARRDRDPNFANNQRRRADAPNDGGSYSQGYRDGFKDGLAKGKTQE
ncbi:hypothetical protein IWW50_002365 [Coemansia erecta]|nr:hypothetical protein GGF43_003989 [Coemansia sp. RSA 2618]KAJ2826414.1 hypothetical protein IWW50_002365 [Coemansia erecta]